MRLSELSGREIVNINDGARLGRIGDADLVIEPRSGRIKRLLLPLGGGAAMAGLVLFGLGCAPVYPCIIHATPLRFGAERSQAFIGVQMASAYLGSTLMSPLFGLISRVPAWGMGLFPFYLAALLVVMFLMHEKLVRTTHI